MNEYYMQIIKDLRLFDDDFMKIVFKEDKQCAKEVINTIMSDNEEIEELYVEDTIKNISGKDIRYDVIT